MTMVLDNSNTDVTREEVIDAAIQELEKVRQEDQEDQDGLKANFELCVVRPKENEDQAPGLGLKIISSGNDHMHALMVEHHAQELQQGLPPHLQALIQLISGAANLADDEQAEPEGQSSHG